MPDTTPTPTPAPKVVCKGNDCGKEYASKGGMMDHYKKKHNSVGEILSATLSLKRRLMSTSMLENVMKYFLSTHVRSVKEKLSAKQL